LKNKKFRLWNQKHKNKLKNKKFKSWKQKKKKNKKRDVIFVIKIFWTSKNIKKFVKRKIFKGANFVIV